MRFQDPCLDASHKLAVTAAELLELADVDPNDEPHVLGPFLAPVAAAGKAAAQHVMTRLERHRREIERFYESMAFIEAGESYSTRNDGTEHRTMTLAEASELLDRGDCLFTAARCGNPSGCGFSRNTKAIANGGLSKPHAVPRGDEDGF